MICPYCKTTNDKQNNVCAQCHKSLRVSLEQIQQLEGEVNSLKKSFEKRVSVLDYEISNLRFLFEQQQKIKEVEKEEKIVTKPIQQEPIKPIEASPPVEKIEISLQKEEKPHQADKNYTFEKKNAEEFYKENPALTQKSNFHHKEEPKEPPKFTKKDKQPQAKKTYMTSPEPVLGEEQKHSAFTEMFGFLADFVLPFAQFRGLLVEVYMHYKRQNKLPVFFMTMGGILALLLGFGYLMQYSSAFYFEILKIAFGFGTSAGVMIWGLRLFKGSEKYKEFGSSLLGLSIALNYLVIYAMSDSIIFPFLSSPVFSLGMIFLNTLLANWFALRHETKVVMVVCIVGGAFAPFYAGANLISIFYFVYLWILCLSAIVIAHAIKWKQGSMVAFITASTAIGILLVDAMNVMSMLHYTLILTAFAYLFLHSSFFERFVPKQKLEREDIFLLATNISLYIISLYTIHDIAQMRWQLGIVYMCNAALFLVGFLLMRSRLEKQMQLLYFIVAGVFIGLAIPQLFDQNLAGVNWAIEAIALVLCGYIFDIGNVRKEGYLLFLISFGTILWSFQEFMTIIPDATMRSTIAYNNLMWLPVIFLVMKLVLWKYRNQAEEYEKAIDICVYEVLSASIFFFVWLAAYSYWQIMAFNVAVVGIYVFLWWGIRNNLFITQLFGWAHLGLIGLGIAHSIMQVNSFIFSFQTNNGKITMLSLFFSFWFLQFFYEKLSEKNPLMPVSKLLREIFYLAVPLSFLGYIKRNYSDYIPLAFWGSVSVAFVLNIVVKRVALLAELHILIGYATFLILATFSLNPLISQYSAVAGTFILLLILLIKKGYDEAEIQKSSHAFIFLYAFYYWALMVGLAAYRFTAQNFLLILGLPSVFLFCLVIARQYIKAMHIAYHYRFAYRLGAFLVFCTCVLGFFVRSIDNPYHTVGFVVMGINLIFLVFLVYSKEKYYPHTVQWVWNLDMVLSHLLLVLGYSSILYYWSEEWMGMLLTIILVLHAIILLFQSTNPVYKILLRISILFFVGAIAKLFFFDMEGFATVQKVIVFMVIGVLMLLGSYLFMRYKEKEQTDIEE